MSKYSGGIGGGGGGTPGAHAPTHEVGGTDEVSHNDLIDYVVAEHREIDDAGFGTTDLWSASKINAEIAAVASGIDIKDPVETGTVAGDGNIILSGEQTINGVLTSSDRVCLNDQTAGAENGAWVTAAGAWTRPTDFDEDAEVTNGAVFYVQGATSTLFRSRYLLITPDPITIDVTVLDFAVLTPIEFGTTAGTATEGNDSRVPTQDENDALVGTGTPSSVDVYVNNSDSRMTDARAPTAHASNHTDGTDDIQNATAAQKGLATAAQITKLDGIAAGAEVNPDVVPQAEAEAGTATTERIWTAQRVGQAIAALASGGGGAQLGSFDANDAIFPATDPAAVSARNGHPLLGFDDGTDESVIFYGVMSNDYSDGALAVDVDWVAETATAGVAGWDAEFERIAPGGQDIDSNGFAAAQSASSTTNGTSGIVTRTSIAFTQAQADAIEAGDAFRLRLTRDTGVGSNLTNDAQVLRVSVRQ